jgi:hypothetical protein
MLHTHKVSQTKKISFVAGLVLTVAALFGTATVAVSKVAAADCDSSSNAIIYCGFSSPSNFISKVRGNDSGNGHHDLQSVYSFYGLNAADYDAFAAHAVEKNGGSGRTEHLQFYG